MSDPRMKAVLHEMAEKKAWQNCLAQDIHNMIHALTLTQSRISEQNELNK